MIPPLTVNGLSIATVANTLPWLASANIIHNNSPGNMGIGINNPSEKL